ncbi:hypothetical protein ACHAWF_011818 [Thalassiosira exigua]
MAPPSSTKASPPLKRRRDPHLAPRSILDRPALTKALTSRGLILKDGRLDAFYQLLHRAGYPDLGAFAGDLLRDGEGGGGGGNGKGGGGGEDGKGGELDRAFRTKNAVSSRPGRRPRLPRAFLSALADLAAADEFVTIASNVKARQTSRDGTTTKLAVELRDGHVVESVLMRHGKRVTICVSSQVGCAMGCTFCATGTMGIRGDLSSGEILEQLVHGSRILASEGSDLIRNVVFMGMGEPLNNYRNVLAACRSLLDRRTWNLAHRRVTVSTVGVPSRMRDLTRDLPEVNLALSLHAPDQATREKIVPAARGTPVEALIEALDGHMMALSPGGGGGARGDNPQGAQGSDRGGKGGDGDVAGYGAEDRRNAGKKRRAMIEYVMLEGETSTLAAAHRLGKLCEGRHLVVNLIPYNKTDVEDELSCPSEERMIEFRRIVSSYGSFCSIRRTMGADIAGACGQLVVDDEKKKKERGGGVGDIEDGPFGGGGGGGDGREKRAAAVSSRRGRGGTKEEEAKDRGGGGDPRWVRGLVVATAVAASCFVVSGSLLLLRKRRR